MATRQKTEFHKKNVATWKLISSDVLFYKNENRLHPFNK